MSTKNPQKSVTAQTVYGLNVHNINTFSDHSSCHADTSKAFAKGLDIDIIRGSRVFEKIFSPKNFFFQINVNHFKNILSKFQLDQSKTTRDMALCIPTPLN